MTLTAYAMSTGTMMIRIRKGKKNYLCTLVEALQIFGDAEITNITNKSGKELVTVK